MKHDIASLRVVDLKQADLASYKKHLADCVIKTRDGRLLMQYRPASWGKWADVTNTFGGHVESGESAMQGLVRELNEELGAVVNPAEVVFLGALTEDMSGHTEIVHCHFWHDREGTITGCYEAEAREYDTLDEVLAIPKLMDYARWALLEARLRGLI